MFRRRRDEREHLALLAPRRSRSGQHRHSPQRNSELTLFTVLQAGDINPFTLQPFSKRYADIFAVRKKLPVHQQMNEFLEMFNANQFVVLSGETGSGKTTQCVPSPSSSPRMAAPT